MSSRRRRHAEKGKERGDFGLSRSRNAVKMYADSEGGSRNRWKIEPLYDCEI